MTNEQGYKKYPSSVVQHCQAPSLLISYRIVNLQQTRLPSNDQPARTQKHPSSVIQYCQDLSTSIRRPFMVRASGEDTRSTQTVWYNIIKVPSSHPSSHIVSPPSTLGFGFTCFWRFMFYMFFGSFGWEALFLKT